MNLVTGCRVSSRHQYLSLADLLKPGHVLTSCFLQKKSHASHVGLILKHRSKKCESSYVSCQLFHSAFGSVEQTCLDTSNSMPTQRIRSERSDVVASCTHLSNRLPFPLHLSGCQDARLASRRACTAIQNGYLVPFVTKYATHPAQLKKTCRHSHLAATTRWQPFLLGELVLHSGHLHNCGLRRHRANQPKRTTVLHVLVHSLVPHQLHSRCSVLEWRSYIQTYTRRQREV